jgi:hypothetical protein
VAMVLACRANPVCWPGHFGIPLLWMHCMHAARLLPFFFVRTTPRLATSVASLWCGRGCARFVPRLSLPGGLLRLRSHPTGNRDDGGTYGSRFTSRCLAPSRGWVARAGHRGWRFQVEPSLPLVTPWLLSSLPTEGSCPNRRLRGVCTCGRRLLGAHAWGMPHAWWWLPVCDGPARRLWVLVVQVTAWCMVWRWYGALYWRPPVSQAARMRAGPDGGGDAAGRRPRGGSGGG